MWQTHVDLIGDVRKFHEQVLKLDLSGPPTMHSPEWLVERARFLMEELSEFLTDGLKGNIVGAADGLMDLVYVALGTAIQMRLPVRPIWDAVQVANMSKVPGTTKRGDKVDAQKPEGWHGPEQQIAYLIGEAVEHATK